MKKQTKKIHFNVKHLEEYISDKISCFYLKTVKDHFAFYPYHLLDLHEAINELLNKKIGNYSFRLDGILCGYKNIKLSKTGTIHEDSPFIHINIEADYFIFKPMLQKRLTGVVNKKSKDHVGCLVYNLFNVSLPKPKHGENWIGDTITLHSEIELEITYTNFDGRIPYIRGEIKKIIKEADDAKANNDESVLVKRKKNKSDESTEINSSLTFETNQDISSKRKLFFEFETDDKSLQASKKKKKKKERSDVY